MTPPHLHDGVRLVSTKSAIPCARLFVEHTLDKWGAYTLIREAVRQVDDLVTMAVNATGITEDRSKWTELTRIEFITVRLLGFKESVRIEVWDSAPNPPVLPEAVGGYVRRGSYPTPRGKVVWAELSLMRQRRAPTPESEHEKAGPKYQRLAPPLLTPPPEWFGQTQDPEFLRRIKNGLEKL